MVIENMSQSRNPIGQSTLDHFIDVAGHDLRIPITALKGQVQLMQRRLRKDGGRERDLADLDKIAYQIERLNQELDIYLAAAHISKRRFEVHPEPGDLVAIAERVANIYARGSSAHLVRFEAAREHIPGEWDRRRIEQALGVLISNALRYSAGGEVLLRVALEGDQARIEVADRGVGVPPGERAKIFEAYTQGSNVENGGVGLGLHVARAIAKKHGGRIGVRARPGGGSVFWIELPLEQAASRRHEPRLTPGTAPTPSPAHTAPTSQSSERTAVAMTGVLREETLS
jgi:signal transduction histidine kinase